MDNDEKEKLYQDCVFDTCMVPDPDMQKDFICEGAEKLQKLCWEEYNVGIDGWRDPDFCCKYCIMFFFVN